MQFYALSRGGTLHSAWVAKRQTDYFCVECQKVVRLRGGFRKRLHFYHLDPSPSCRLNGKSPTHLAIQLHIQALFSKEMLKIEEPFASIGRIADCVCHAKKMVFEVQCSPIAAQEVKERIEDYGKVGYHVVWILHDKQFKKRRRSAAEVFLERRFRFFYTNMDSEGRGMIYKRCDKALQYPIDLTQLTPTPYTKEKNFFLRLFTSLLKGKLIFPRWSKFQ